MKIYRISAITMRHLLPALREFYRLIDLLYWPVLDLINWGFTGLWLKNSSTTVDASLAILLALTFWLVVNRAQLEISLSLMEEFWSRNMINLFATPLGLGEWIIAAMILGIIKSFFTFVLSAVTVKLCFGISLMSFGLTLIPLFFLMLCSGWAIGFLTSAILLTAGQKVQSLVWAMPWLAAPFSAVFYPVAVLPAWAQKIAYALPTTYLFEGIRELASDTSISWYAWQMSIILNALYMSIGLGIFWWAYRLSKQRGLARLEHE